MHNLLSPVFFNLRSQSHFWLLHIDNFQFRITIRAEDNFANYQPLYSYFCFALWTLCHDILLLVDTLVDTGGGKPRPYAYQLPLKSPYDGQKKALHPLRKDEEHYLSWYHLHSPTSCNMSLGVQVITCTNLLTGVNRQSFTFAPCTISSRSFGVFFTVWLYGLSSNRPLSV
jgi:hypothetical protein